MARRGPRQVLSLSLFLYRGATALNGAEEPTTSRQSSALAPPPAMPSRARRAATCRSLRLHSMLAFCLSHRPAVRCPRGRGWKLGEGPEGPRETPLIELERGKIGK